MISGNGIFGKMVFWENRILGKCDFGKRGFLSIGIWDFGKMRFWENGMIVFSENGILGIELFGKWDNWVCIKSRALGVKVDRRSQSQPAGLEQGARERAEVLVI